MRPHAKTLATLLGSCRRSVFAYGLPAGLLATGCTDAPPEPPHSVLLFVADGLRPSSVSGTETPALFQVRTSGTYFANSHSLFPTLTMTNAASLSTGFGVGTTGVFGNYLYSGFAVASAGDNPAPFLEQDAVLGELAGHYDGNFVGEHGLLFLARAAGLSTAAVGKLGPTLLQDATARAGTDTFVLDDSTGSMSGVALDPELARRMQATGLPLVAPARGDNGKRGDAITPGTLVANSAQQQYFLDVTTKVLLPLFSERGRPFLLVYWSRDPDGTQHNQGDSLNTLTPGINGPTARAAVREADRNLAALRVALAEQNLAGTTDVIVTSDHGFSTISKGSNTSFAKGQSYTDVPAGFLPPGFLAIDLAQTLGLPLYDGEQLKPMPVRIDATAGQHPKTGSGLLGVDPKTPEVVIAVNGNTDLLYLPGPNAATLLPKIVDFLLTQDYVSGLWVDDSLGTVAGTLPLSQIGLLGAARTPRPALVVGFASGDTGCGEPSACGFAVTDWNLQQGQGFHGSFGRADIANNMAAVGPDFRSGYRDPVPVSNADVGVTVARLLGLALPADPLRGRLLSEALVGPWASPEPTFTPGTLTSSPAGPQQQQTVVRYQDADGVRYFDAGGFAGRTNGL